LVYKTQKKNAKAWPWVGGKKYTSGEPRKRPNKIFWASWRDVKKKKKEKGGRHVRDLENPLKKKAYLQLQNAKKKAPRKNKALKGNLLKATNGRPKNRKALKDQRAGQDFSLKPESVCTVGEKEDRAR